MPPARPQIRGITRACSERHFVLETPATLYVGNPLIQRDRGDTLRARSHVGRTAFREVARRSANELVRGGYRGAGVTDDDLFQDRFGEIRQLGPAGLVELAAKVAFMNMSARMNVALGIHSEQYADACGMKPLAVVSRV